MCRYIWLSKLAWRGVLEADKHEVGMPHCTAIVRLQLRHEGAYDPAARIRQMAKLGPPFFQTKPSDYVHPSSLGCASLGCGKLRDYEPHGGFIIFADSSTGGSWALDVLIMDLAAYIHRNRASVYIGFSVTGPRL